MTDRNTNTNTTSGYWDEAFYNAYTAGYKHVLQESRDAYAGTTMVDRLEGENKAYDFVGTIELTKKAKRFEDLPLDDVAHNRRWMSPVYYRKRVFVDDEDQIALLADPTSAYIQAMAKGIIRLKNDVIYAAFDANVSGGENPGELNYVLDVTNAFTTASAAGRLIPHDATNSFAKGGTSAGLTIEKLILARQALTELHNDPNQMFFMSVSPRDMSNLIREAETQSYDTSPFKSLAVGGVPEFMGFKFITDYNIALGTTNDADGDTNVTECYAWAKEGVLFAQHEAPIFKVDWHVDKQVYQVSARVGMNAIRMDENCVVKVENYYA
jgi:hypothetical protein